MSVCVCVLIDDCVVVGGQSCEPHVSCVNEQMSYKCDCVSRLKQRAKTIGMCGGQMTYFKV